MKRRKRMNTQERNPYLLRNVLGQPERRFTFWEKVYIGFMTIVLSCRIALYVLLRIAECVKRPI